MSKIKTSTKTVTKTIEAKVYEVPLTTILKGGCISYEEWDDEGEGFCLAVGNECSDTFVGLFVDGKLVDPKDVMIAIAEEVMDE
jgi:hypothetical protein